MRFSRVLLVAPRYSQGIHRLSMAPMTGVGYIAEALRRAGVETRVLDMNLHYGFVDLEKMMHEFRPDMVGVSIMTFGHREQYRLMNGIKERFPDVTVVAGGPHVSTLRDKVLEQCPGIDYGVVLEGDITVVRLCEGEAPGSIQGLLYREGGAVRHNQYTEFIGDLDSLGFPKYESFELNKYATRQMGIITSRGCPYNCIYCPVITAIGKKFRYRSAASVIDEIVYWYGRGYREILILDDNFTLLKPRVEEICRRLVELNLKGLSLKCPNGIRADRVDRALLKLMKDAGFDRIAFGVEAGNDKVLATIKKGESIATIERSIADACELGFEVSLFFIIGSPGETMADIEDSFSLALRYPVAGARFYNIVPFPTTELYDWIASNNLFLLPPEKIMNNASHFVNTPCFATPELTADDRRRAFMKGNEISRRIRRKFIERKLTFPLFMRPALSYLYTVPLIEWLLVNNAPVVRAKELLKKALFKHQ